MGSVHNLKRSLAGAAALSLILNSAFLQAAAQSAEGSGREVLAIPAGTLGDVLSEISLRTGVPVIFAEELVEGRRAPPVAGTYSAEEAVRRVLAGTGLEVRAGRNGVLRIIRAAAHGEPAVAASVRRPSQQVQPELRGEEADLRIDQVVVTGTNLRGIAPESSPLQIYTREDILGSGVTTTEQFIRTLPQNFGGGSTDFTPRGLPGDYNSTSNNTNGTGANLRGLGSRGTLILLNGNRLAPSSTVGDFVDVSLIPVSALERVDVLTDGASSVYGGDAVAGVMNFVLRKDFEGSETSVRFGSVTEGSLEEYRISQTLGTAWSRGNVLATVEFHDRGNLTLGDRPEIGELTGLNGQPIPSGDRLDLFPSQERTSAVLALRHEPLDGLELSGTALYSDRSGRRNYFQTSSALAPLQESRSGSETVNLALGAGYALTDSWTVSLNGSYSRVLSDEANRLFSVPDPDPVLYQTRSDLLAMDLRLAGALLDLPGGMVQAAAGVHFREEEFQNQIVGRDADSLGQRDVSAIYGEIQVPLFGERNHMPGLRRLEVNLSGRMDDYSDFGSRTNPKIGVFWSPVSSLNVRASYGKSFSPPPLGRTGALDRSATIVPYTFIRNALGIPLPDPSLANVSYVFSGGTSPDLRPETSESLTAGFDFEASTGAVDWTLKSTWYRIEFEDRINRVPVPDNLNGHFAPSLAFDNPGVFPPGTVVFYPTAAEVAAFLGSLNRAPQIAPGAGTDNIGIINNVLMVQNVASTVTEGVDAQLGSAFDTPAGRLRASLNGSYILGFRQQAGPSTPAIDVRNTLYNPVGLQLRGQLGIVRGAASANLFVNYTDAYRADSTPDAARIDSWTTVDLSLSHELSRFPLAGSGRTTVGLSVINAFDTPPPATPANRDYRISGYDPANASPLGRFIAAELRIAF